MLDAVIVVNGSQSSSGAAYATSISFSGFSVTQTRTTFLEMYEVPSGGDWGVHRGAALFVQDAENVTIAGLRFGQVGGNGVMLSNHVTDSLVADCDFRWSGDSAILLLGATDAVDAGKPTYPNRNSVVRSSVFEVGVFGKQTSAFAQFLAANTTVRDSVFLNGPRAAINLNDGAFGGSLFENNVAANFVRETLDHGVVNTWDRYPYLAFTGVDDGFGDAQGRSIIKANDTFRANMLVNGYSGVWALDHDDGSAHFRDSENFLVFGGVKNFLGSHKVFAGNVILYPGTPARSVGNRACATDDNNVYAEQHFDGNVCAVENAVFYSFFGCSADDVNSTTFGSSYNTLFSDASDFTVCGNLSFAAWQTLGKDEGSVLAPTPPVAELVALGASKVISELRRHR